MDSGKRRVKPRLLLMGQRRSGKSSIANVVFHKIEPQETLYLESTTQIQKETMNSFMDFQVWDFPGQLDYLDATFDTNEIFSEIGSLIWVIDAQDDYSESLSLLNKTAVNLAQVYPHTNIEVFIHKTDNLNDDYRADVYTDITNRVRDEMADYGYVDPLIDFYLTSIYDSTVFEALSKVIQKLIPERNVLSNLTNILVNNTAMKKAFLFDIQSKIYVASDTQPQDSSIYEICASYIDLVVDVSDLYNYQRKEDIRLGEQMEEVESSMTLEDGRMIYLKEMNKYLCLVCLIDHPSAKDKKGLIDYNVHIYQEACNGVFERAWEKQPADSV